MPPVPVNGPSPYTYINNDGYPELITISGGMVSQIDIRGSNTNLINGVFLLQPTDSIIVTYKIAPVIVKIPQ
jgi:hypothetical protein